MTAEQVLMIAIPAAVAILVLFGVAVASSRRDTEGTRKPADPRIAALASVPGGTEMSEAEPAATATVDTATVEGRSVSVQEPAVTAAAEGERSSAAATGVATALSPPPGPAPEDTTDEGPVGTIPSPRPAQPAQIEEVPLPEPADPEAAGITRRQVLNRGILLAAGAVLTAWGGAMLAFLWPRLSGGFGSVINAGNINEIKEAIRSSREPYYNPSGRFYLMTYETALSTEEGNKIYPGIFDAMKQSGLVAIYQKCAHLGCRVPWCKTSQWFECPCHGSKYNAAGEWQGGPAPRGLWHFPIRLSGDNVSVDTGNQVNGPPKGTNTPIDGEPKGPHCVGL